MASGNAPVADKAAPGDLSRLPTQERVAISDHVPKPVYSNVYGQMDLKESGLDTQAEVTGTGHSSSITVYSI